MSYDSEGLMDFGAGAFSGAEAGAKASNGNPWVTGGSALALGALSFFGGKSQRRLQDKVNDLQLKGMGQDLELGDLNISEAKRNRTKSLEADKRKELFSQMLAQYFQQKGLA